MRPLLLLSLVVASGCASMMPFTFQPRAANVRELTAKYPRALAVILEREDRVVFCVNPSMPPQVQRHDVIAILADGGERWANVQIPLGSGRLAFCARVGVLLLTSSDPLPASDHWPEHLLAAADALMYYDKRARR